MGIRKDLVGQSFGRWTPIRDLGFINIGEQRNHTYICRCSCGVEKAVLSGSLTSGNSKSCGCYHKQLLRDRSKLPDGVASFNELHYKYKADAKKRHLEFSLSEEEFSGLTKSLCNYCGVVPSKVYSHKRLTPYIYNGVDRVDNSKGYTVENCVPCCHTCNIAKHSMPLEEFLAWIDRLVTFRTNLKVRP